MKYILAALLFLAATGAQASTLKLEFDVTVTRNGCAGDFESGGCGLTFDGLKVGETYQGQISVGNVISPTDTNLYPDEGTSIDVTKSFDLNYFYADWTCQIGGLDCYTSNRRIFFYEGRFNYETGLGSFWVWSNSTYQYFTLGGNIGLVDDQGLAFQVFNATASAATSTVSNKISAVPLPASSWLLIAALGSLAFRRKNR